jgi:hypothetical protein
LSVESSNPLGAALRALSHAIRASVSIDDSKAVKLTAAENLSSWLWLWENHDGPSVVAEHGDAWLIPQMQALLFNFRSAGSDPKFQLRLPGHRVGEPPAIQHMHSSNPVTPLIEDALQDADAVLRQVVARYQAHFPAHAPPMDDLEIFHLPLVILLASRTGDRALSPGGEINLSPLRGETMDPLAALLERRDLVMTRWWLDEPSFTAATLNSYSVSQYNNESLLHHTLHEPAWVDFWLTKGVSPWGPKGLRISETPLFETHNEEVFQRLVDAGVDPDTRDEKGLLPEESNPQKNNPIGIHRAAQHAREGLGRKESVTEADWRHQFKLVSQYEKPTNAAFQKRLKKGPWPVWCPLSVEQGVLEYLARQKTDKATTQLRLLCKSWGTLPGEFRRAHHDSIPDWAIAHAMTNGTQEFNGNQRKISLLLPETPTSADVLGLIQAWTKYTTGGGKREVKPWATRAEVQAVMGPEHIAPLRAFLTQLEIEMKEDFSPLTVENLRSGGTLAFNLWETAADTDDRKALWVSTVMSLPDTLGPAQDVHDKAMAAANPELWEHLDQSSLWRDFHFREALAGNRLGEYEANIRHAKTFADVPTQAPRRARPRP